jgi:DNA invertase Pin-like site-specific DNA recombinase
MSPKCKPAGPQAIAISYTRWSDPKQSDGNTRKRQAHAFRQFCERHVLTPATDRYSDDGLSGYKDEHRKKGALGRLVALAKEGAFTPGTVIVVEAWDRLGRLRADKQTELIAELLRTGVRIGICRLDDIFCEDDFGTHKWTTLSVFMTLAYQESKQKAERCGGVPRPAAGGRHRGWPLPTSRDAAAARAEAAEMCLSANWGPGWRRPIPARGRARRPAGKRGGNPPGASRSVLFRRRAQARSLRSQVRKLSRLTGKFFQEQWAPESLHQAASHPRDTGRVSRCGLGGG